MTHAYSEMYLDDAMRTLGEAVDFALCDQGLTPAELTAILSNALEMKQFERGIPRVVCGMIVIEKWNNAQADKKGLKAARKAAGLTQK